MNAHREGVEFGFFEEEEEGGERKGTYRKGKERAAHTRHGGKQKNAGQCFIPTFIYSPLFSCVYVRRSQFFERYFLSPVSGECSVSSAPQRRADSVTQPLNFPSRLGTGEKSCYCCC